MIGQTVSHYCILGKIGGGGMGVVYKAEDTRLKRIVALKFLPPDLTRDEDTKKRFIAEAQAAAALDHPNICDVHDIGETNDGQLFIVMTFYDGETLNKRIERGPLEITEALDIAAQIGEGLAKAHSQGIVHRDVKPANVMITGEGVAKIVDFGLARLAGQTMLTRTGTTVGTAAYMSPEQARGEEIDQRTDIWSLGVVIYHMLTGQLPFKGEYQNALLYAITNTLPRPIASLRPDVPPQLERIISRCLSKDPSERYQQISEFLADVKQLKEETGYSGIGQTSKRGRISDRKPGTRMLATLGILAGVIIAIFLILRPFLEHDLGKQKLEPASKLQSEWKKSMAVLPFADLSPRKDQEYFCDGMLEEIITRLTSMRELKVTSRTSVVRYRGTALDIKEIGKELGVGSILEGSIRRENNNIRVSAQLINVADGFHLWADTYDRRLESVFEVQGQIAKSIAEALKVEFGSSAPDLVDTVRPRNLEAYEYYLKGMHFIKSKYLISLDEKDFEGGVRMFEKAIRIDTSYALAYAGLSWAYEHHYYVTDDEKDLNGSRRNCQIAYDLDPTSPLILATRGYYYYAYDQDFDKAFQCLRQGLRANPNVAEVNFLTGVVCQYLGLYDQGIRYLSKAVELDPYYFWAPYKLGMAYADVGEFDKAAKYFEKYLEVAPTIAIYPGRYASLCIKMKQFEKADALLARAEKSDSGATWVKKSRALWYAAQGKRDKALELWKDSEVYALLGMTDEAIAHLPEEIRPDVFPRYVAHPYLFYIYLLRDPFYDNLRSDSRFKEIVEKERKLYQEYLKKYGDV